MESLSRKNSTRHSELFGRSRRVLFSSTAAARDRGSIVFPVPAWHQLFDSRLLDIGCIGQLPTPKLDINYNHEQDNAEASAGAIASSALSNRPLGQGPTIVLTISNQSRRR